MKNWLLKPDAFLSEEEIKRLVRFCSLRAEHDERRELKTWSKTWLAVHLGLRAGLRVSEVANLKVKNVFVGQKQSTLLIERSKGGRSRIVFIDEALRIHLKRYWGYRRQIGEGEAEHLLVNGANLKSYTASGLEKAWHRARVQAGIARPLGFHCLRHSYGTWLYKATKDLRLVQNQLGHSSPSVTQVYADVLEESAKEGVNKAFDFLVSTINGTP
ncbi:MAG: site-specific integrase [Elusimicrobia bacterium]|nr:site-specific integrase [Elusimicrobiota bacterium]